MLSICVYKCTSFNYRSEAAHKCMLELWCKCTTTHGSHVPSLLIFFKLCAGKQPKHARVGHVPSSNGCGTFGLEVW